jgi:hypothetical protein
VPAQAQARLFHVLRVNGSNTHDLYGLWGVLWESRTALTEIGLLLSRPPHNQRMMLRRVKESPPAQTEDPTRPYVDLRALGADVPGYLLVALHREEEKPCHTPLRETQYGPLNAHACGVLFEGSRQDQWVVLWDVHPGRLERVVGVKSCLLSLCVWVGVSALRWSEET